MFPIHVIFICLVYRVLNNDRNVVLHLYRLFSDLRLLGPNVAVTRFLRNGEKYYVCFIDNLLLFLTAKEFSKSVNS